MAGAAGRTKQTLETEVDENSMPKDYAQSQTIDNFQNDAFYEWLLL